MGGRIMGTDPATSVTDGHGRVHGLDNVYVADGSVFVTSGAHNPTHTIMSVGPRNMRHLAGPALRVAGSRLAWRPRLEMLLLRDHTAHLDDQVADVLHAVAGLQPGED